MRLWSVVAGKRRVDACYSVSRIDACIIFLPLTHIAVTKPDVNVVDCRKDRNARFRVQLAYAVKPNGTPFRIPSIRRSESPPLFLSSFDQSHMCS